MDFQHVTTWIFDLDNTLYAPEINLFTQIETRMTSYVMRLLDVDQAHAAALRVSYWRDHGTTLAGLMAEHGIDPLPFLRDVHDIDFAALLPDPALAAAITALPGRKIIHTNADSTYARHVLERRGLMIFDAIHGVEETGFHPKPTSSAYQAVLHAEQFDPATAAMFEDDPRNLAVPHQLGMRTVLVGNGCGGPDKVAPDHRHGPHVQHQTSDLLSFLRGLAITPTQASIDKTHNTPRMP